MDRRDLHGQQFLRLEQMMQIGFRVDAVDVAAIGIDGREVVLPFFVAHVHRPFVGEEHSVTAIASGHHTVEHIYATFDGLKDVLGRADTHQITGTVLGQDLVHHFDHVVHYLGGLSHSQPANRGTAIIVQLSQDVAYVFSSILTQVFICAALYDGEERLVMAIKWLRLVEALHASFQPPLCKF